MKFNTQSRRRQDSRLSRGRRGIVPAIEMFERRQLLAAGPLQITFTEVETNQSVTITDNLVGDTDPVLGAIGYDTLLGSPFTDFTINGFQGFSNRVNALTKGQLVQTGTILRSTSTGGDKTLLITATDTGFTYPIYPTVLNSSASATFTNSTSSDVATFQSFANTTASPVVSLHPTPSLTTSSDSQTAAATVFTGPSPYDLKNVYQLTLGQNNGSIPTLIKHLGDLAKSYH